MLETELKWITFFFSLGLNGNTHHKGNNFKMTDVDVFSLLECKKHNVRIQGKCKSSSIKCKICVEKRINTYLKDLSFVTNNHV